MLGTLLLLISAISASTSNDLVKMNWVTIDGKLRELTVARDFDSGDKEIYGISSNGQVWTCRLPCDGQKNKWAQIPGKGASIAANEQEVWKTNSDFTIDRCQKPCSGDWRRQSGLLRQISMGPEVLWGVNHFDDVFRTDVRRGVGPNWQFMSAGNKFSHVSVGIDTDVWAILKSGEVARFSPLDRTWRRIPGKGKRISVGVRHLYLVDENDKLMRCERPCRDGKWIPVENGNVRVVAAEWTKDRRVYALQPDNTIVKGTTPVKCPSCCSHSSSALPSYYSSMMMPWQSYLSSAASMNTNQTQSLPQYQSPQYPSYPSYPSYWTNGQYQQLWSAPSSYGGYGTYVNMTTPQVYQNGQYMWPWQMPWWQQQQQPQQWNYHY